MPTMHMRPSRSLIVSCLILCLTGGLAACGGVAPEAREADARLARGDFGGAESAASQALTQHPDNADLWRVKIQAIMGQQDSARAVAVYGEWRARTGRDDAAALQRMARTTLRQGLRVPSAAVRARAIQAIERLEIEELAVEVVQRMGDEEDIVAAAAAVAVLRSHPAAPDEITRLLRSDDPAARAIAVEGIGRKIQGMAHADLVPALADPAADVRLAAIRAIAPMDKPADTARFIAMARGDADGTVRAEALAALDGRPGAVEAALQGLRDAHLGVRLAAVRILANQGEIARLTEIARSQDLFAGLRAAVSLRKRAQRGAAAAGPAPLPDAEIRTIVDQALASAEWNLRAAALNAVAELLPRDTALALAEARLADDSEDVRMAAARVLMRLDARERAVAALAAGLQAQSPWARLQAAEDLAKLGDARGHEALAALAASPDASVREAVVGTLAGTLGSGSMQAGRIPTSLVSALADESPRVRVVAAERLLRHLGR